VIQSFADEPTRVLYLTGEYRRWVSIARVAVRRMETLDFANAIEDLQDAAGHRLEKLKGYRTGEWGIRIDERYLVCFRWDGKDAWDVEIVNYD
jgi:toxin HigB-1